MNTQNHLSTLYHLSLVLYLALNCTEVSFVVCIQLPESPHIHVYVYATRVPGYKSIMHKTVLSGELFPIFWPTVRAPLTYCVVCLSSDVCDVLYCGEMAHPS